MWKEFLTDYFGFTVKGRIGTITIVALTVLIVTCPLLYPFFIKPKHYDCTAFQTDIARLATEKTDSFEIKNSNNSFYRNYNSSAKNVEIIKGEVFYFDPNTASYEEWKKLGIRDKTIHTIQNYLSKGGRFYKPEDISKIWGLSTADAQRLIPYVSLKNQKKEYVSFDKKQYTPSVAIHPVKTNQIVDINLADTTAFITLPGIGSKLSQRIIAFRTKLGGFYSVDQVGETYLLPDSTFQKIKSRLIVNSNDVKKININTASVDEMKAQPYLRYNLANAIYQYKQQHGNFTSVENIKNIMLITDDVYKKIAPYLSVQ